MNSTVLDKYLLPVLPTSSMHAMAKFQGNMHPHDCIRPKQGRARLDLGGLISYSLLTSNIINFSVLITSF